MSYDVNIQRQGISTLIEIQGKSDSVSDWISGLFNHLPVSPNTAVSKGHSSIYWLAPEKWLIRGPIELESELQQSVRLETAPIDMSIVLVSDTLTFFSIEGEDAAQIMAIVSPLDTHQTQFHKNAGTYTEAFGLKSFILRSRNGFEVAVESSFADMFETYFSKICAD
ncbi:MAG: heterotetrameric sarcosine oxidase gamma subunit [Gammaproteobacteria bacterium]|jgi:heterotetrameric sarcosine oxidase gamma subunit